jgi:hypothetical protein
LLARLGPSAMSAIRSLSGAKRTLRGPYQISIFRASLALGIFLVLAPRRLGLICDSGCHLVDFPYRNRIDLLTMPKATCGPSDHARHCCRMSRPSPRWECRATRAPLRLVWGSDWLHVNMNDRRAGNLGRARSLSFRAWFWESRLRRRSYQEYPARSGLPGLA